MVLNFSGIKKINWAICLNPVIEPNFTRNSMIIKIQQLQV